MLMLGLFLIPSLASAQVTLNPVTFGTPAQLDSGSFFPVRTVASITHPDPNDAAKDVIDSIDFDGDGSADIVQVDGGTGNHVTVWLRGASGSYTNVQFGVTAAPAGSITDLAVADLNNDDLPDIIVVAGGAIYLYTNDGDIVHDGESTPRLSFTLAGTLTAQDAHGTAESFTRVAVSDLDNNGLPEVVATSTTINSDTTLSEGHVSVFQHAAGDNTTYNAATVYVMPFGIPAAGAIAIAPVIGGDAFPDVIVSDPTVLTGTELVIFPGKGDGTVVADPNDATLPALRQFLTMTATAIAVGDLDGDGQRDIVLAGSQWADFGNGAQQSIMVNVLHSNGNGFDGALGYLVSSVPMENFPTSTLPTDIALGDFNLDGTLDVAVADSVSPGVAVMSAYIYRDSNTNAYISTALSFPTTFASGQQLRSVSASFVDSDAHIDLVIGSNEPDDTNVLLNTSTPPVPPLTGKKVGFEFSNYTGHVNSDPTVVVNVNRASDSTGQVTVPFTVGGTAIPSGKANSDYNLDFPANKKVVFPDGVYQQQIQFSLSFNSDPAPPKTILLTLGKPVGDAVLAPTNKATITLLNSSTPTIHAANALTIKPSNPLKITAKQLKALGLKGIAYADSPWTFSTTQTLDKKASGLAIKVQYATSAGGPWNDFPGNVMAQTKPGSTTWKTTSSSVPLGTSLYFQTVTSAPGYESQTGAPVGAFGSVPGPRLTLNGEQEPSARTGGTGSFTPGTIVTHNSESITYRFTFGNTGRGQASNVVIDLPLNTHLTHFAAATVPHLPGGQLVQLDRKGKVTSSNTDTVALQYKLGTLSAGATDYVDVIVDVISALEYNPNPKHNDASFGLHVGLPAYRITALDQNVQVYGTPELDAIIQSPLSVTLEHDTNIASPGELVTYTGTVTNTSVDDYHEAKLTVKMPIGAALENVATRATGDVDFTSATINPTGGTNPSLSPFPFQFGNLQTLTWDIGTIPAGHSVIVKFTTRVQYDIQPDYVDAAGVHHTTEVDITNYNLTATPPTGSSITAFQNDDDGPPARVLVSAYDPAALPQIGFIKVATGLGVGGGEIVEDGLAVATVLPGDQIQYDLVYFNTGGSPARGCVIQEEVASGATFTGFIKINGTDPDPNQYVFKDGGGTVLPYKNHTLAQDITKTRILEFHLGNLAANSGGTLSYRVAASVAAGKYILSNGYRMYTESLRDPRPGSPVQVPAKVVKPISFDIRTQADKAAVAPGEFLTYTVRFRNNGGIDANNIVVSSAIPVGTTFVSATAPKLGDEYGRAFAGATIETPVAGSKNPVINFKIPTLKPDEPFVDVNGNLFHESDEPFTDSNSSTFHDGEGIAQFTVQVQNPLPLSLRVPSSILENEATINGTYPSGAQVHAFDGKGFRTNAVLPPGAADKPLPGDSAIDAAAVRLLEPLRANLWAYKSAPHFVTKGQRLMYKVVAGNSGNIAVNNVQIAIQVPFGTTLDAANTTPGYKVADGIATWKMGNIEAHTATGVNLFVTVRNDASYKNDLLEENSCSVKSVTVGSVQANAPEVVPGPSRTTVLSTNPFVAGWQSFCAWLGSLGGNVGQNSGPIEANVHSLNEGTLQVAISGIDVIAVQNGAVIIQNGGGNIVAAGGGNIVASGAGNIVAQGAGNIVAQGAGNIVAQGAGNVITVTSVGLCTQANLSNLIAGIVAQGAGNIVAAGGGNLIGNDGATLLGLDGAPIVAQGGGNLKLSPQQAGIVAAGGGNIVAQGAGNIVAAGGGNIVAQGAGNIVAQGAGNLISNQKGSVVVVNSGGAGLVAVRASAIVAQGAGNIVAQGAGNAIAKGNGN